MKKKSFNCSRQDLYLICRIGWQNCMTYLEHFTAFKARYTEQYIALRLEEVDAAEAIPDERNRDSKQKDDRNQEKQAADLCLDKYTALKRYIMAAYPPDQVEAKLQAAGQFYFKKANGYNRDALNNLNITAITFVTTYQADLKDNQNMPDAFLQNYITAKNTFSNATTRYLNCRADVKDTTTESYRMNMDVYGKLIEMFEDAKQIFKGDNVMLRKFSFNELFGLASGVGVAGLRGYVTLAGTKVIIKGATVTISYKDKTTETDADGYFEFLQLTGGAQYTVTISKTGFQTVVKENVPIKKSTFTMLRVAMEPVPVTEGELVMS